MYEFPLHDHGAGTHDGGCFIADYQDVIGVVAGGDEVVASVELGESGFADGCEDAEGGEEAYVGSQWDVSWRSKDRK